MSALLAGVDAVSSLLRFWICVLEKFRLPIAIGAPPAANMARVYCSR
jgi:hypothetical protein